jgi:hypothetical protein
MFNGLILILVYLLVMGGSLFFVMYWAARLAIRHEIHRQPTRGNETRSNTRKAA